MSRSFAIIGLVSSMGRGVVAACATRKRCNNASASAACRRAGLEL